MSTNFLNLLHTITLESACATILKFSSHTWKRANKPTDPFHPAKSRYKKCKREFRKLLRKVAQKQKFDFFRKLDVHTYNSEKLFRPQPALNEIPKLCFQHWSRGCGTCGTGSWGFEGVHSNPPLGPQKILCILSAVPVH